MPAGRVKTRFSFLLPHRESVGVLSTFSRSVLEGVDKAFSFLPHVEQAGFAILGKVSGGRGIIEGLASFPHNRPEGFTSPVGRRRLIGVSGMISKRLRKIFSLFFGHAEQAGGGILGMMRRGREISKTLATFAHGEPEGFDILAVRRRGKGIADEAGIGDPAFQVGVLGV